MIVNCSEPRPAYCRSVEAAEYVHRLYLLWTGQDVARSIGDWVEDTTGRRPYIVRLPSLYADRRDMINTIATLHLDALNMVVDRLRSDLRRLQPFYYDSEAAKAAKLEIVRAESARLERAYAAAVEEVRSEQRRWHSSSGSIQPTLGSAYRQLVNSSLTGVGIPRNF